MVYTVDPTHNRLSEEVPGTSSGAGDPGDQDEPTDPSDGTSGGVTPYTYASDSHRLLDVGGIPRSYDATGNTTQIDNQTLIYNATGRLAEVREGALTIATYAYNGRGERVQKATGGPAKTFVYDETGRLLGEYSPAGFVEYLWLDGLLVGVSTPSGLHRIETDHLGTPRVAKGQFGNTTWRWAIEDNAFGQKPAEVIGDGDSPGLELNLRFPGQYFDEETGLHYNYFRDYDPGVGRYVESDPIGLYGGPNSFAYVTGNPLTASDPTGLVEWTGSGSCISFLTITTCTFDLVSECIAGKRTKAKVRFVGPGLGFGRFSFTESRSSFRDPFNTPFPDAFNQPLGIGEGAFVASGGLNLGASAGQMLGRTMIGIDPTEPTGGGCSAISLGLVGGVGCGGTSGFEIGLGVSVGSSTLIHQEKEECGCPSK